MSHSIFKIVSNTSAEGWLMKEGHDFFKSWQDRYFVLDSETRTIKYYTEGQKLNLKGEYQLTATSTVESSNADRTHPNLFCVTGKSIKGESRSELYISASSAALKNNWISAIRKAIKGEPLVSLAEKFEEVNNKIAHEIKVDMGLEKREGHEEPCCAGCTIA
jgi:hypothetical protein